jgi:hypothetical protein
MQLDLTLKIGLDSHRKHTVKFDDDGDNEDKYSHT